MEKIENTEKNRYRLLVLDIDGTVTNSQKVVTPKTREAIIQLQEKGIPVAIASGRPHQGIAPIAEVLEFEKYGGYVLAFNGARIINWKTKEIVYSKYLPASLPKKLQKDAVKNGVGIVTYTEHDTLLSGTDNIEYSQIESRICHLPIEYSDDYGRDVTFPVNKCIFSGDPDDMGRMEPEIQEKYGHEAEVFRSEDFYLEVMPKNVDKAYCLEKLNEILGISREETVCCGDSYNDLTMLQYAGLGVAMENAKEEVKMIADYITGSNDEDGIVQVIEKFFFCV